MRFARQATIFRGPLDPAAVVGVLFLLVIFMMLGSLLYTPGVLIRFDSSATPDAQTITITRNGSILFAGKTNTVADLEQMRAEDLKNALGNQPFRLELEPGADPKLAEQVRNLFQIRLPEGGTNYLTGTDNPTVIVAVNFRGQCFFENRPVQEQELKAELRSRFLEISRASKNLTMVLWADGATENKVIMHLYKLAQDVGITECLLAERPNEFNPPAGHMQP